MFTCCWRRTPCWPVVADDVTETSVPAAAAVVVVEVGLLLRL